MSLSRHRLSKPAWVIRFLLYAISLKYSRLATLPVGEEAGPISAKNHFLCGHEILVIGIGNWGSLAIRIAS
jgi:hypothetical protein